MGTSLEIIEQDIELLEQVLPLVPELEVRDPIRQRLKDKVALALVAKWGGELAGFKLGYERTSAVLYSWVGGVVPRFRRMGVAQALLDRQESWAKANGYRAIEVKSMNKYPQMLIFLIKNHYEIYGFEGGSASSRSKILFHKELEG